MNPSKAEKLFELMKRHGVEHFKTMELEIRMHSSQIAMPEISPKPSIPDSKPAPPLQAIPPNEMKIPHHVNEVANLLKLNDEQLVDKLFPDFSQQAVNNA
jgi:hypothetical protein